LAALTILQAAAMSKPKNFIKKTIADDKGGLHKSLGIPQGQPIPAAALKKAATQPGKVGQQARLAETLEKFHKKRGK
jgi:hypothetical protein